MVSGPFLLLRFKSGKGDPIAFVDGFTDVHGAAYYDRAQEVDRYDAAFADIWKDTLGEQQSKDLIARQAKEFERV